MVGGDSGLVSSNGDGSRVKVGTLSCMAVLCAVCRYQFCFVVSACKRKSFGTETVSLVSHFHPLQPKLLASFHILLQN